MARPVDWKPLAAVDPVPGDPKEIREEVEHMKNVAKKLRDQADKLEKIAKKEGLKGKYSETLTEGAGDLAKKLDQAAGRYETVKTHLSGWADDLQAAQTKAGTALDLAPSDEEQAKKDLKKAKQDYDDAADHHAGLIEKAIDDDALTDSWWDNVKDWVDKNAGWLKVVIEIASYVATALAIAAIFVSGIGIGIVLAAGIAVLVARVGMAAAGQGSWADVALDVFALATMGLGRGAVTGLKAGQAATRLAAGQGAKKAATSAAKNGMNKVYGQAGRTLAAKGATKGQRKAAREAIENANKLAGKAGDGAEMLAKKAPLPKVSKMDIIKAGGDKDAAVAYKDIMKTRAAYAADDGVHAASQGAEDYLRHSQQVFAAGQGIDLGGKALGASDTVDKPYFEPFQDYKNEYTAEVGSTW
ncbi:putative T7SS-secreted protein [Streptomyces sp. Je 1-332]|uniref:putative T7SS-secreted protein n=1 Tax=Streptomyces sp. Je 1-332 TaxID=3231270 RepID=UPI00345A5991